MSWLQPKLHLKVSQRQILTPGLVQMVSVLALNRLELREMLNQELVANPVLEELTEEGPVSEDYSTETFLKAETEKLPDTEAPNPFDEFDVSALYQYLDSGSNEGANRERETIERPSFEKFLSSPTGLTEHLEWQLHGIVCTEKVREIAETIIGNLDEDGYLTASLDEVALNGGYTMDDVEEALAVVQEFDPLGVAARNLRECLLIQLHVLDPQNTLAHQLVSECLPKKTLAAGSSVPAEPVVRRSARRPAEVHEDAAETAAEEDTGTEQHADSEEALPVSVEALAEIATAANPSTNGDAPAAAPLVEPDSPLWKLLQSNQLKEIARALNRPYELVKRAMDVIPSSIPAPVCATTKRRRASSSRTFISARWTTTGRFF